MPKGGEWPDVLPFPSAQASWECCGHSCLEASRARSSAQPYQALWCGSCPSPGHVYGTGMLPQGSPPSSAAAPLSLSNPLFLATTKPKAWAGSGSISWGQGRHGGRVVDLCGQRSEQDTAPRLGIQTKTRSSAITTLDDYPSLCLFVCTCVKSESLRWDVGICLFKNSQMVSVYSQV